jgi:hypothetical protein
VNRTCHEFLSRSGLAEDEHSGIAWRHGLNALQHGLESRSFADHVSDVVVEPNLVFEIEFLGSEALFDRRD